MFLQTSSSEVSLAVGAERKRGADQQDALQLAAQLGARNQGGGRGANARNGTGVHVGGGEGSTDKEKKIKNLRKVSVAYFLCVCHEFFDVQHRNSSR